MFQHKVDTLWRPHVEVGTEEAVLINNTGMRSLRNIILFTAGEIDCVSLVGFKCLWQGDGQRPPIKKACISKTQSRVVRLSLRCSRSVQCGAVNLAFVSTGTLCDFAHYNL